jgi:hypothetical protein
MRSTLLIILAALAGLAIWPGAAQAAPRPAREQLMPAVAFNPHPEILTFTLVWVEDRGGGPDIYAKRLFNNGLPQGGSDKGGWQVIRDSSPYQGGKPGPGPRSDPRLVYNGTREEFLLVFGEDAGGTDGWDVFGVRVNSAGYAVGNPRRIAGGPGDQRHPDVAVVEDGEYLVVWDDNARDVDEVWAQRLQANAIQKGKPYVLVRQPSNATDPTVSGDLVAWVDDVGGQQDIWALRLKNGLPNGAPYRAGGDGALDDFNPRYGAGGLVWNVYDPGTGNDIVGAQVYNNGTTRGGSVGILVPAADQTWPDIANGVVVFADNRSGEYDLYGVRVAGSDIRARGKEFPLVLDTAGP